MTDFFIPAAQAAEAGSPTGGFPIDILLIAAFALVFYFLIWRPQSKRTKEHRQLVASLDTGDEVVTNGGLIGKVTKVDEQFLTLEAAEGIELKMQKGAVAAVLPKGTIKSI
ncbi:MAG: preprotein translocase subunit YajC [Pseudomonadales bacterium]